ncbi:MAG TPA: hypothetical protein VF173_34730 [Thermoanaerobaculia bacterium]|nr:hypothetical protein [Thermoanaerobaculia bacterium]
MTPKTRSQIRVDQTRRELDRTRADVRAWCEKWRRRDKARQFETPRLLLEGVLERSLSLLQARLGDLPGALATGNVYRECARFDQRLVWVRRLWQYYASKLDQRENGQLAPVLSAADEVVWSCYAEVFQNARGGAARGPSPLPYVEPLYSAQAMPRVDVPPDLRLDMDRDFFTACLEQLPISLVALPSLCVDAPWWLIFLGHEVGHHVQFDLLPPRALFLAFGKFLGAAADQGVPGQGERWKPWSPEIFADAFSVHALGPWAARAIAELETKDDLGMLTETSSGRSAYPAPWVRLSFLAAVAAELDPQDEIAHNCLFHDNLPAPPPEAPDGVTLRHQAELAIATLPKVVEAVVNESLEGMGTLKQLCGWQPSYFSRGGLVDRWAAALQGDPELLLPERSLPAPRLIISGALAAWTQVSAIADDREAERARANLAANLLSIIPRSAEEGVRAAEHEERKDPQEFADALTGLLLERQPLAV